MKWEVMSSYQKDRRLSSKAFLALHPRVALSPGGVLDICFRANSLYCPESASSSTVGLAVVQLQSSSDNPTELPYQRPQGLAMNVQAESSAGLGLIQVGPHLSQSSEISGVCEKETETERERQREREGDREEAPRLPVASVLVSVCASLISHIKRRERGLSKASGESLAGRHVAWP